MEPLNLAICDDLPEERKALLALLEQAPIPTVCTQFASSEELLAAVRPQMAAISCGVDNDYGHPHATVLRRLQEYGVEVWRTDTVGSITFTYHNGALEAHPVQLQDAAA